MFFEMSYELVSLHTSVRLFGTAKALRARRVGVFSRAGRAAQEKIQRGGFLGVLCVFVVHYF